MSHWEQTGKCGSCFNSCLGLPQGGTVTSEQNKLLPATSVFIHVFIEAIKLLAACALISHCHSMHITVDGQEITHRLILFDKSRVPLRGAIFNDRD